MKIAIVGSRHYPQMHLIGNLLAGILPPRSRIITGDAAGVDREVAIQAAIHHHTIEVHQAHWAKLGKNAGPVRNREILECCDLLIAFWDLHSPGTKDITDTAQALAIPTYIYGPAGELIPPLPMLFESPNPLCLPDMSGPEFDPIAPATSPAPLVV